MFEYEVFPQSHVLKTQKCLEIGLLEVTAPWGLTVYRIIGRWTALTKRSKSLELQGARVSRLNLIPQPLLLGCLILLLPAYNEVSCPAPSHSLPHHRPVTIDPVSLGLESLKSWAKMNIYPSKLLFLRIRHINEKLTQKFYGKKKEYHSFLKALYLKTKQTIGKSKVLHCM